MRTLLTTTAVAISVAITIAAPSVAQARFGAGAIADAVIAPSAQPAQYYGGRYRYSRPNYRPRYYGGGYSDYRRHGYAGSRDALDTCAYC